VRLTALLRGGEADEAIQKAPLTTLDCFAALAMTRLNYESRRLALVATAAAAVRFSTPSLA
jgi:hypothetical protein